MAPHECRLSSATSPRSSLVLCSLSESSCIFIFQIAGFPCRFYEILVFLLFIALPLFFLLELPVWLRRFAFPSARLKSTFLLNCGPRFTIPICFTKFQTSRLLYVETNTGRFSMWMMFPFCSPISSFQVASVYVTPPIPSPSPFLRLSKDASILTSPSLILDCSDVSPPPPPTQNLFFSYKVFLEICCLRTFLIPPPPSP